MNSGALKAGIGAAVGAVIGVAIGDATHLTSYWPHLVVAVCAAAGVLLVMAVWGPKVRT